MFQAWLLHSRPGAGPHALRPSMAITLVRGAEFRGPLPPKNTPGHDGKNTSGFH